MPTRLHVLKVNKASNKCAFDRAGAGTLAQEVKAKRFKRYHKIFCHGGKKKPFHLSNKLKKHVENLKETFSFGETTGFQIPPNIF